jgi:D-tyrosyl-tRNA(Tyr) deacylase
MKALLQRVSSASVVINNTVAGAIGQGLLVLLGVEKEDTPATADKLLEKLLNYRVFSDADGKMNLSVRDIKGGVLMVSQFTLAAETRKGLRPGFSGAAAPSQAEALYDYCVQRLAELHSPVASGEFAADMKVHLVNDGPVTFLLEI